MLAFLILSALALAFAGAVAIPFIVMTAIFWIITFPIRLAFKLIGAVLSTVFGLGGALLGFIIGPIVMIVVAVAVVVALLSALVSLLAPLLPLALLALLVWGIYRITRRPTPAF
jgi:hypothetical protein